MDFLWNRIVTFFVSLKQNSKPTRKSIGVLTEAWSVRWFSRWGEFSTETRQECEIFTSESEANEFANQLREAFQLIRHTSNSKVTVEQTQVNSCLIKKETVVIEKEEFTYYS